LVCPQWSANSWLPDETRRLRNPGRKSGPTIWDENEALDAENFGESHDLVENKGSVLRTLESPTISMRAKDLSDLAHYLYENRYVTGQGSRNQFQSGGRDVSLSGEDAPLGMTPDAETNRTFCGIVWRR
jgi:hypothetical protein